jgi:chromosome segregation ATPase
MTEAEKNANFYVWLGLCFIVLIGYVVRNIRKRREPPKSRQEAIEHALGTWRMTRDELEAKADIKELAQKARASFPSPIYAGEESAKDPAEEERRSQIESHNIRLHFNKTMRELYFSVADIDLRKRLIEHDLKLEELTREQLVAEIDRAKSEARKADETLAQAEKKLADAISKRLSAKSVLQDLEDMMSRQEEQRFSAEEAQTGKPNDPWFIEQAWATYPKRNG